MTVNQKLILIAGFLIAGVSLLLFAATHPMAGPNPLNLGGGFLCAASALFTILFFVAE